MLLRSFFLNPYMKTARSAVRNRMMVRKPPDLPPPGRAIRCLMTPPPRSASINPCSALLIASRSARSSRAALRAQHAQSVLEIGDQVGRLFQPDMQPHHRSAEITAAGGAGDEARGR